GYTAHDHLRAIERHTYDGIVDFVIANNEKIPKSLLERYTEENSYMVPIDEESFTGGTTLVQGNLLLVKDEQIRHNFSRLARAVM
ncbi:YvcK family protein, partial [Klebsiella oxytoca]